VQLTLFTSVFSHAITLPLSQKKMAKQIAKAAQVQDFFLVIPFITSYYRCLKRNIQDKIFTSPLDNTPYSE